MLVVPTGWMYTEVDGATMLLRWTSLLWWLQGVWPLWYAIILGKQNTTNTMHVLIVGHSHWMIPISIGHLSEFLTPNVMCDQNNMIVNNLL